MPAVLSLRRFRLLWVLIMLFAGWMPSRAAEPTSMMSMTDKQFADWLVGTEWSFGYAEGEKAGQKRKVWFVAPDVGLYTRVGDQSAAGVCSAPWKVEKKGTLIFSPDHDFAKAWTLVVAPDLKTAVLSRAKEKEVKVTMTGRRVLGNSLEMTIPEFTAFLRGVRLTFWEKDYTEFPEDGKVRQYQGKEFNWDLRVISPGVTCFHWEEKLTSPIVYVFSKDLKTVKCYHRDGISEAKVTPTKAQAAAAQSFSSAKISMDNLKPVPLLASAVAVKALLVRELGNSKLAGSASVLSISALPLQGDAAATIAFNQDVGQTMGKALREVARYVALRHGGWPRAQEMQLSFEDKYGAKDGPSAATACALLLDSLFTGAKLDPRFAVTGDLNADGSIQPIGGVQAKLRGATRLKCELLGIPAKNAAQATDIALTEGLKPFTDIQVFTLSKFDEALALGRADKAADLSAAIGDFDELMKSTKGDPRALRTPDSGEKLRSVLKRAPNHFSAQVLLLAASGKLPKTLSPAGTLSEVDQAVGDLKTAIGGDLTANTNLNSGQITAARSGLTKLRTLADPRVRPLLDAWADWGNLADTLVRGGGNLNAKQLQEWRTAGDRISVEEQKLRSNEAFSEDLQ